MMVIDALILKCTIILNDPLGCLIVEIHDHREPDLETTTKRIVMKPTAESIWTDITLLSEQWGFTWTEDIALQVEAQILVNRRINPWTWTCIDFSIALIDRLPLKSHFVWIPRFKYPASVMRLNLQLEREN